MMSEGLFEAVYLKSKLTKHSSKTGDLLSKVNELIKTLLHENEEQLKSEKKQKKKAKKEISEASSSESGKKTSKAAKSPDNLVPIHSKKSTNSILL